jgi:hypothetical protein
MLFDETRLRLRFNFNSVSVTVPESRVCGKFDSLTAEIAANLVFHSLRCSMRERRHLGRQSSATL